MNQVKDKILLEIKKRNNQTNSLDSKIKTILDFLEALN